jgi:hypothetical protein
MFLSNIKPASVGGISITQFLASFSALSRKVSSALVLCKEPMLVTAIATKHITEMILFEKVIIFRDL